jgi:hypothetical protein
MRAKREPGNLLSVDAGYPATILEPNPLSELTGFSGGRRRRIGDLSIP